MAWIWKVTLLAMVTVGAHAQPTYKCGNTYSQSPCSDGAQAVKIYKGGERSSSGVTGEALCRQAVPRALSLADPDSAKVESVGQPKGTVFKVGQQPVEAMRHTVAVNAKNEYGAYTGARLYHCDLSIDGQRVLHVEAAR